MSRRRIKHQEEVVPKTTQNMAQDSWVLVQLC